MLAADREAAVLLGDREPEAAELGEPDDDVLGDVGVRRGGRARRPDGSCPRRSGGTSRGRGRTPRRGAPGPVPWRGSCSAISLEELRRAVRSRRTAAASPRSAASTPHTPSRPSTFDCEVGDRVGDERARRASTRTRRAPRSRASPGSPRPRWPRARGRTRAPGARRAWSTEMRPSTARRVREVACSGRRRASAASSTALRAAASWSVTARQPNERSRTGSAAEVDRADVSRAGVVAGRWARSSAVVGDGRRRGGGRWGRSSGRRGGGRASVAGDGGRGGGRPRAARCRLAPGTACALGLDDLLVTAGHGLRLERGTARRGGVNTASARQVAAVGREVDRRRRRASRTGLPSTPGSSPCTCRRRRRTASCAST